jgi:HEAT repeat protein
MSWFHQLRNEQQPLTQEHAAFLLGFKDQKKFDDLWTNPDAIAKIVAIGGRPAEDLIVRALHSKNESVQRNAAVAAQQCISSRAGVENTLLRDPAVTALEHKGLTELNKRVLDKPTSTAVRTAAIAAIGNAARWNCGYAQKLLADLAKGKKLDPSDRVLAVSALAEPLPCITMAKVYDDDIILPTLAELLDDDAAPVRRAAFAALSKVKADGFGYNPEADGKARKDAVKQWREWATAKASFYAKQPKP